MYVIFSIPCSGKQLKFWEMTEADLVQTGDQGH